VTPKHPPGPPMTLGNMLLSGAVTLAILGFAFGPQAAHSETPDEWIALGTRVHGGFGSYIPVGIRIGLDALQRLNVKPPEVTVTYYDSELAPCACIADGVGLATVASVGQRSLRIAEEKAPDGALAVIIVRSKTTREAIRYIVTANWLPKLAEWNRTLDPRGRYDEVMKADQLFEVSPVN
jgi:formylmethanofuran dehydrogenase subunit E